ncbi:hypothetical protein TNCV_555921 [Trichonephila clavipes]|uniref:Uncharacterized protein n=1 Tax=Trichonephila clavipes TaxID=2585209 RepID=A0A8X6RQD1_TRICX|nr:hypothetical protein TNCV_555921 [Trichonephila clavipes]
MRLYHWTKRGSFGKSENHSPHGSKRCGQLEDAGKNEWTMADFSVIMVLVDLGPQRIKRTDLLIDQESQRLIHRYQPSDLRPTQE